MDTFDELDNIITLKDEKGHDAPFEFLDVIEYEDEEYVVLLPTDIPEGEPGEVVILKVEDSEGAEEAYVGVEDQEALDAVFKIFKEKFNDTFDFEKSDDFTAGTEVLSDIEDLADIENVVDILQMKDEALRRLRSICNRFNLGPKLINYLKEDKLYYSYAYSMDKITCDERYPVFVKSFEDEYHCFVYHVIEADTAFGKMLSLIYVSNNEIEWSEEELTDENSIMTYTFIIENDNLNCWKKGEFGQIGLDSPMGYLMRIW